MIYFPLKNYALMKLLSIINNREPFKEILPKLTEHSARYHSKKENNENQNAKVAEITILMYS